MILNAGTCENEADWVKLVQGAAIREVSAKSESPTLFRQEFVDKDSLKRRHAFVVFELEIEVK